MLDVARLIDEALPPIFGGEFPIAGVTPGTEGGEGVAPADGGGGPLTDSTEFVAGGQRYEPTDVLRWKDDSDNRTTWESSQKKKDEALARGRRWMQSWEAAYGRPVDQWGDREWAATQTAQMLETRIRTQPGFLQKLNDAIVKINEEIGMTPAQARREAGKTVEEIREAGSAAGPGAGQPARDPRLDGIDRRLTAFENQQKAAEQQRTYSAVENHGMGLLQTSVQKYARDYPEDHGAIMELVISSMIADGIENNDMLEMAREGTLQREFDSRVRNVVGGFDTRYKAHMARLGKQVRDGKAGARPAPSKGGAGAAAPVTPPAGDADDRRAALHARARALLTAP